MFNEGCKFFNDGFMFIFCLMVIELLLMLEVGKGMRGE